MRAQLDDVETALAQAVRSDDEFVADVARYLVDAGGKRFRPLVCVLAAHFGDATRPEIVPAAVVVELTHLATLYHDDVMDEASVRRGAVAANVRWDNAVAILTGDFLFSRASDLLADLGTHAVRLQARTFGRLVTGQIRETVGAARGRRPDRALPRGARRQDRFADRHVRRVRRVLRRRARDAHRHAAALRRADRHRLPALRRPARHRVRVDRVGQDARARTCARASPPCPCCTRCATPTRRARGCANSCRRRRSPTTPSTPRRCSCCGPPGDGHRARDHARLRRCRARRSSPICPTSPRAPRSRRCVIWSPTERAEL